MILGSRLIKECIRTGAICVHNEEDNLVIGPNSVDVRLGKLWRPVPRVATIDPCDPSTKLEYEELSLPSTIHSGECLLGCTAERFSINNFAVADLIQRHCPMFNISDIQIVQEYHGRSTVGRLFLASHVTAAFGDVGFEGAWTLELVNHNNVGIRLHPGMRIGQVAFSIVLSAESYTGAYMGQLTAPMAPVLGKDRF